MTADEAKQGFDLAIDYINKCPCDPDITKEQADAWIKLQDFIREKGTETYDRR
jgi:hypothetical protein